MQSYQQQSWAICKTKKPLSYINIFFGEFPILQNKTLICNTFEIIWYFKMHYKYTILSKIWFPDSSIAVVLPRWWWQVSFFFKVYYKFSFYSPLLIYLMSKSFNISKFIKNTLNETWIWTKCLIVEKDLEIFWAAKVLQTTFWKVS